MTTSFKNKQHRYASYAIEHGLKRLKLYHKDQKQLKNFYKYCDVHKECLEIEETVKLLDLTDIKSRTIIDDFIHKLHYERFIGDFPNLYHYEMEKLKDVLKRKLYDIYHSFEPIVVNVESDFEPYSGIRKFKTPRDAYSDYSSNDVWCYGYCDYKGNSYNLGSLDDCIKLFEDYKFKEDLS